MTFDPAAVQHAYEVIASDYETTFADELENNEFDRAVVDAAIASVPEGELVLDVGCGPAQVSRRVLARGGRSAPTSHRRCWRSLVARCRTCP